jgi:hypothetical protein
VLTPSASLGIEGAGDVCATLRVHSHDDANALAAATIRFLLEGAIEFEVSRATRLCCRGLNRRECDECNQ